MPVSSLLVALLTLFITFCFELLSSHLSITLILQSCVARSNLHREKHRDIISCSVSVLCTASNNPCCAKKSGLTTRDYITPSITVLSESRESQWCDQFHNHYNPIARTEEYFARLPLPGLQTQHSYIYLIVQYYDIRVMLVG